MQLLADPRLGLNQDTAKTCSVNVSFNAVPPQNDAYQERAQPFEAAGSVLRSTTGNMTYPPDPNMDVSAKPWILPEQTPITFIHANVIDVAESKVLRNMTVKLKGGKVDSLEKTTPGRAAGLSHDEWKGAVIDASGFFMCPGLIDCHVHIMITPGLDPYVSRDTSVLRSTWVLKNMLSLGFTTVRDVGGATKSQADATAEWLIPGPRLFQGGPVLSQTGGHGDFTDPWGPQQRGDGTRGDGLVGRLIDGVPEALRAARDLMRKGADHIKITTSGGVGTLWDKLEGIQLTVEEIQAISTTVKNMGGIITISHCYTPEGIRHSIAGGVGGIEHGNLLDEATAEFMAGKGIFLTPTLSAHALMASPPFNKMMDPVQFKKNEIVRKAGLKAIQIAEKAGVTVCYGSDLSGPMHPFQTNEFVVRSAVLPSPTILKHATINGAKLLKMEGKIGAIVPGAFADILFMKANPLEDVTIFDKPNEYQLGVMKDGRMVKSKIAGLKVEIVL